VAGDVLSFWLISPEEELHNHGRYISGALDKACAVSLEEAGSI
jgi:hypothetical protein